MDPATLAAIIGPVTQLLSKQYDIAYEVIFGDEKRRKQAALQDAFRENPWITPTDYKTDNSFLYAVAGLSVVFIVLALAFVLSRKK